MSELAFLQDGGEMGERMRAHDWLTCGFAVWHDRFAPDPVVQGPLREARKPTLINLWPNFCTRPKAAISAASLLPRARGMLQFMLCEFSRWSRKHLPSCFVPPPAPPLRACDKGIGNDANV